MPGRYLLAGTKSNCLPFLRRITGFATLRPVLVARVGGLSLTLRSNTSGFCVLLPSHPETSSTSGLGLAHCNVGTRGRHIYLVFWADQPWNQGSVSGYSRVLKVKKGIIVFLPSRLRAVVLSNKMYLICCAKANMI